jgi:hypothetical protein
MSARGAIARRGTFRPCRSGFESPRADHPEGIPSESTRQVLVAEGRDGDLGGLISLGMRVRFPPPLPDAGSSNGRTAVLQAAHGGSIPSPATSLHGERKITASPGGCVPPSAGSIPAAHPNLTHRVVG